MLRQESFRCPMYLTLSVLLRSVNPFWAEPREIFRSFGRAPRRVESETVPFVFRGARPFLPAPDRYYGERRRAGSSSRATVRSEFWKRSPSNPACTPWQQQGPEERSRKNQYRQVSGAYTVHAAVVVGTDTHTHANTCACVCVHGRKRACAPKTPEMAQRALLLFRGEGDSRCHENKRKSCSPRWISAVCVCVCVVRESVR